MYKYDYPDGWTCIGCGDEYIEDVYGKFISDYKEGTLCEGSVFSFYLYKKKNSIRMSNV